jgi:hypothetical protein
MGRRKSAKELAKQLEYAKKLEAYNPPVREENGKTQRRPKISVKYKVTSPLAPLNTAFTIQASKESVEFFGKGTLNLADQSTDPSAPRGFKPNRMMATVADASPALVRAKGSTRPYIRYGKGTRDSNVQYNYTAPITTSGGASTLDSAVSAAVAAVKNKLGGAFGRVWFEPEDYPYSASGV